MDRPAVAEALDRHPRVALGHAPTPIDRAPALGAHFDVDLAVKRDDCTGLAFGGNKVRQLEYYLGEARSRDADTVLITGAVQSNFVRLTAAAARSLGMEPHVQLEERVSGGDAAYRSSGNVLLDRILGATIDSFPVGEDEGAADRALEERAAALAAAGRRPYVIHLGVEHPPIGALGYVRAGLEIGAQLRAAGDRVDHLVVASGSGLTHAGLLVGVRAAGIDAAVHGVCVRRDMSLQHPRVARRVREVEALLGCAGLVDDDDVRVTDATLAPGYGRLNDATFSAITAAARTEGLLLDPVYTGKALAGIGALVAGGAIERGSRVLFVHTGGGPALFAYQSVIEPFLGDA